MILFSVLSSKGVDHFLNGTVQILLPKGKMLILNLTRRYRIERDDYVAENYCDRKPMGHVGDRTIFTRRGGGIDHRKYGFCA